MEHPKVSVVIPTYNAEKTIECCLKGVFNQNYNIFEVIVVDDYSKDKTVKIAQKFDVKLIKLSKNNGPGFSRNVGIKHSSGDYIYFVDSDSVPEKNCLSLLIKEISKSDKIAIVGGPNPVAKEIKNTITKAYDITNRYSHTQFREKCYVSYLPTANFLSRKEIFKIVGLFDSRLLTHQDFDFCTRVKKKEFKICFQPNAIAYHYHQRVTLKDYLKYAYKGGVYGTIFRLKHKPYVPYSFLYPRNIVLYILLLPFLISASVARVIIINLKFRSIIEILIYLPFIFLNQSIMFIGGIKGVYLYNSKFR